MLRCLLLLGVSCFPVFSGPDVFGAIRANDLSVLRSLGAGEVEVRDRNGVTPLLYASAMGSLEGMQILIDRGADVNAADNGGSTPLLWAACDANRVRLLLEKGAVATAKTKQGRTPVMAASACDGGAETVGLLLAKGADVNAVSADGQTAMMEAAFAGGPRVMRVLLEAGAKADVMDGGGFTALMGAVGWDDAALARMLLAKGAKVNAASAFAGKVVHGDIQLKRLTALMMAVPFGSRELVKVLLDAGAEVNARDGRGMTPLQFAVATPRPDVGVIQMLLRKGAEVNAVSGDGETALDWARKYGVREVVSVLEKAGGKGAAMAAAPERKQAPLPARAAAEKSVGLLQSSVDTFFAKSNCVACHHQPMAALAVKAAREAGMGVDEKKFGLMKQTMVALLAPRPTATLGMETGPAGLDGLTNTTLALAAAGQDAGLLTDSAVVHVAMKQRGDGSWGESMGMSRAPMFGSPVTMTVNAMRAIQVYPIPSRKAELDGRVARAREWLLRVRARTAYEQAEVLMGLGWAGAEAAALRAAGRALVKMQRSDGGWAQMAGLGSDAYATGLALRAMKEAGVAVEFDAAYAKGVDYMLRTQLEDGSWYVRSRAVKLQPYFQSGFPHGHEQWISYVATANGVIGLLR